MPLTSSPPTGFLSSLRQLLDTALGWREEKARAITLALSAAVLLFAGFMAMITLTFLAVVAFWDYAVWVLLGFGLFYLVTGLIAYVILRSRLKTPPFSESLRQLKKDREWLFSNR